MVVIHSKNVDDFVNNVIDYLDCNFVRIGESNKVKIEEMDFSNENSSYIIKTDFLKNVDLQNIQSVWFNGGLISAGLDAYENKCYEILNDSFLSQKHIKKIGRRIADFEANRLDIMLEAKFQGLQIPHTLITGNKDKLNIFYDSFNDQHGIISKRILDNHHYEDDEFLYNFNLTFKITPEIFEKIPNEFSISFFQERIIADFEIRVIYIDGNFYSVAIHNVVDKVDYRTEFQNPKNLRLIPFKLPNAIELKLEKVFKKFNLNYGSADFMYSNDNYYFLEINPTGQISFANNSCNYNLEYKLAQILKNEK